MRSIGCQTIKTEFNPGKETKTFLTNASLRRSKEDAPKLEWVLARADPDQTFSTSSTDTAESLYEGESNINIRVESSDSDETDNLPQSLACDKPDAILMKISHHCELLHAAVQRLEEKVDSLQSNAGAQTQASMYEDVSQRTHPWSPPWKESLSQLSRHSQQVPVPKKPSSDSSTVRSSSGKLCPQPAQARGKPRGQGQSQGRASKRKSQAKVPEAESQVPAKVVPTESSDGLVRSEKESKKSPLKVTNAVEGRATKLDTASTAEGYRFVLIGSPFRKVHIPISVYMKVLRETQAQTAVALVLHAIFPPSVISCSGVTGNPARGVKMLDPNKVEAIREWLAEMFPVQELGVRGVDWADCLGIINRILKEARLKMTQVETEMGLQL